MAETAIERWISRLFHLVRLGCRGRLFALVVLLVSSTAVRAFAQNRKPTEYEVKAAYLYNFGKFIKWPPSVVSAQPTFPICVLGSDPFGNSLDSIAAGEALDGKRLSVIRIDSAAEAQKCRILFVGSSEQGSVGTALSIVRKWPVLTVSDIPEFLSHGGDIEFVMQGDRVRFQVNLWAAEQAGLSLSSELLKVAVAVKRNNQAGE